MQPEQRPCHPFVQQHRQHGDDGAFQQVQGRDAQQNKGGDIADPAPDGCPHGDDGVQGNAVQLGELGQKINGVEGAAEHGHDQRADGKADDGAVLALVGVVENGGGKNQRASYHEIGKIAHKGGGGAFQKQLQQDFHALANHGGAGS